jgi:hypothetical protein
MCYLGLGDFSRCIQLLENGKELVVRAGVQGGQMECFLLNIEAVAYQLKTEYSDARRIQEAILNQTSAVLSPVEHAYALTNIACCDIVTGARADVVSRNLNAAAIAFRNANYQRGISACEVHQADLFLREGHTVRARAEYMRLFSGARSADTELACLCLVKLADSTYPVHHDAEVARCAMVFLAFTMCVLGRNRLATHQALRCLGDVLVRQGAEDTGLSVLIVALDGFTQMDVHQGKAECMRTIGDVYVQRGDFCRAREMWEAARPLFERSEQKKEVSRIDEKLQTLAVAQKLHNIPKVHSPIPQAIFQDSGGDSEAQKPLLISAQ